LKIQFPTQQLHLSMISDKQSDYSGCSKCPPRMNDRCLTA